LLTVNILLTIDIKCNIVKHFWKTTASRYSYLAT